MYNYKKVITMKTAYVITVIGCILILAAGLIAGCTSTSPATENLVTHPNPTGTIPSVPTPLTTTMVTGTSPVAGTTIHTLYVNSTTNGEIVTIPMGTRVLVRLNENPTTGYTWNATASKGLDIISDTYTAPDTSRMGAAGYHEWILSPKTVDTYIFKTVSLRPWEGAKATDDSFSLVILVTKD
jgi:predicted secreted protein